MWWNIATDESKQQLIKLVQNGQLEIVTGGWVMTDEANAHYYAMVDQMIEGHEWLSRHLRIVPKYGWAIDPLGYSPTMAYLLKKMQFDAMLIQRVHYAIKKHFAQKKFLEFRWRQSWSSNNKTDVACHVMPFYFYDIPHTCGPDPSVCCQFDFARLPKGKYKCPWGLPAAAVTNDSVRSLSVKLLDQYRKKSKLFKTDSLLVTLGDDFRYTDSLETENQFSNYEKIISYVNAHPELNADLKFATLSEFFNAVKDETNRYTHLPSLTGDFFTYADIDEAYWSGYYSTRPFYKVQERTLQSHLRAAEIFFSFAMPVSSSSGVLKSFFQADNPLLLEARQNLALFQHHDGTTGTSKQAVVVDYGEKLMKSLMDTKRLIRYSAALLLAHHSTNLRSHEMLFDFDEIHVKQNQLPITKVIKITNEPVVVVICNSLAYYRAGLVSLHVNDPHVIVTTATGKIVPSQINLIWTKDVEYKNETFEIQFMAITPALGLSTFKLRFDVERSRHTYPMVFLYNSIPKSNNFAVNDLFDITLSNFIDENHLILENDKLKVRFSSFGLLQSVFDKKSKMITEVSLEFVQYKSRTVGKPSGAYLFYPLGPASPLFSRQPIVRVIRGPISSEIQAQFPSILHRVVLYYDQSNMQSSALHIHNQIDMQSSEKNLEIAMRIKPSIASGGYFFTDLNGFQMQRRKIYSKLPLQANFYPMPTMAFVQDKNSRLSLLTKQPLGVSLVDEAIDVILDRKLSNDDSRGQGVVDNVPTSESFVLLIEKWRSDSLYKWNSSLAYPSLLAHRLSWELLHPLMSMSLRDSPEMESMFQTEYSPLKGPPWPCDVHLVNLRSLLRDLTYPVYQAALILHRVGYEVDLNSHRLFKTSCYDKGYHVEVKSLPITNVRKTSLSLQFDEDFSYENETMDVKRMEIESFKVVIIG